jgi:hypothetical protein
MPLERSPPPQSGLDRSNTSSPPMPRLSLQCSARDGMPPTTAPRTTTSTVSGLPLGSPLQAKSNLNITNHMVTCDEIEEQAGAKARHNLIPPAGGTPQRGLVHNGVYQAWSLPDPPRTHGHAGPTPFDHMPFGATISGQGDQGANFAGPPKMPSWWADMWTNLQQRQQLADDVHHVDDAHNLNEPQQTHTMDSRAWPTQSLPPQHFAPTQRTRPAPATYATQAASAVAPIPSATSATTGAPGAAGKPQTPYAPAAPNGLRKYEHGMGAFTFTAPATNSNLINDNVNVNHVSKALKLIPRFSGSNMHPVLFIDQLEGMLVSYKLSFGQFQLLAHMVFTDEAASWAAYSVHFAVTFADFRKVFLDRFWGPVKQCEVRRQIDTGFYSRNQGSYVDYFSRLVFEARFLAPPYPLEHLILLLASHFPEHVAPSIIRSRTLEEATETLRLLDQVQARSRPRVNFTEQAPGPAHRSFGNGRLPLPPSQSTRWHSPSRPGTNAVPASTPRRVAHLDFTEEESCDLHACDAAPGNE